MKTNLLALLLALFSVSVMAETRTVTLKVPSMNCATCPLTVTKALENVDGVSQAQVTYETRLAVVTFDDEKTTVDALVEATGNAGYPSNLVENKDQ